MAKKRTDRQVVEDLIAAWEKLPAGREYSVEHVGDWLQDTMAPAMNRARRHLGRSTPSPDKLRFMPYDRR